MRDRVQGAFPPILHGLPKPPRYRVGSLEAAPLATMRVPEESMRKWEANRRPHRSAVGKSCFWAAARKRAQRFRKSFGQG